MKVGQVKIATSELRTGDLYGNRFSIALRLTERIEKIDIANIEAAVSNIKQYGFVNYFGMQRFGNNPKFHTHDIGRTNLQIYENLA